MKTLLLAAALLAAPAAAAQSPGATLDRAVAAYARVRTVRASFEQTLTNPLLGSTAHATGELVQLRPRHLSIRFSDPANDRIVADGTSLWLYLPSTAPGQVIRAPLAGGSQYAGPADITATLLEAPRTRWTVADAGTAVVGGRATHALRLTPKDASLPFTAATVWVDDADAYVRQFEVTDASGVVRKVTINKLTVNGPADRAQFTFTVPKGVRVVDAR